MHPFLRTLLISVLLPTASSFATGSKHLLKKCRSEQDCRDTKLALSVQDVAHDIGVSVPALQAGIPGYLLYPSVFAACFRIGAAIAVIGQPRLPSDDNDGYRVGSRVVRLPRLKSRVRLFYPCSDQGTDGTAATEGRYCTDGRETSDGMAGLVGFRQIGLSFLLAHLADAPSGCCEDPSGTGGPSIRDGAGYPLLVYSHGYGGNMDMSTYFLRGLARKGFVVAAVEHTDGTASSTRLSDGTRLGFDPRRSSLRDGLRLRSEELLEAVDYLPVLFPGSIGRVFLGGHSYGAPSALLASQKRPGGISGLVMHDPALGMGSGSLSLPPAVPAVSYVSDEYHRAGIACGDATYHVRGAFHGNFVDAPLWAPLWIMRTLSLVIPACGPADPEKVHEQLAESAIAFAADPSGREGVDRGLFERVV